VVLVSTFSQKFELADSSPFGWVKCEVDDLAAEEFSQERLSRCSRLQKSQHDNSLASSSNPCFFHSSCERWI
jgi:hypothetical protein